MRNHSWMRKGSVLAAALLALAACKGSTGSTGAAGPTGPTGSTGSPGVSTGTITGTLTYSTLAGAPASGITVSTTPANGVAPVQSGTDGSYTLVSVPAGVYTVTFSGGGLSAPVTVTGVSVAAGVPYTLSQAFTTTNPIKITLDPAVNAYAPYAPTAATAPAGFAKPVTLKALATGGTAPYTYAWSYVIPKNGAGVVDPARALPAPTVTANADGSITFTTGDFATLATSPVMVGNLGASPPILPRGLVVPDRAQMVSITPSILGAMTYTFKVTVTDAAGVVNSTNVTVSPAALSTGNSQTTSTADTAFAAIGMPYIGSDSGTNFTWSLSYKATSAGTVVDETSLLDSTTIKNPMFVPDAAGFYTLTNAVTGSSIKLAAGTYLGASATCGFCHTPGGTGDTVLQAKLKEWSNSAHGNYFFKLMEYDTAGNLEWKAGVTSLATADPATSWNPASLPVDGGGHPLRMPLFEFGLTGGEGSHYSATCVACHTTGFNAAPSAEGIRNSGFYQMNFDKASGTDWTFPNLTSFGNATASPVLTYYDDPNLDHTLEGMQCEACHGPLGKHGSSFRPAAPFNVAACAYCHDAPTHHDKVYLWNQSSHASYARTSEGMVEDNPVSISTSTGLPSGVSSCGRCHAAQGFAAYLSQRAPGACSSFTNANLADSVNGYGTLGLSGTLVIRNADGTCTNVDSTNLTAANTYFGGLGMNAQRAENTSCAVCHDPHTTELRLGDSTGVLANGWQMDGAGAGAICMVCHNSRNGVRGDGFTPPATANGGIRTPHTPVQADLLMGVNAYFMSGFSGSTLSKHAWVADTCAGCHVALHPDSVTPASTNHTFKADGTICKNCHGPDFSLDGIKAQFVAQRAAVGYGLAAGLNTAVGASGQLWLKASTVTYGASGSPSIGTTSAAFQVVAPTTIVKVEFLGTGILRLVFSSSASLANLPAGFADPAGSTSVLVSSGNILKDSAGTKFIATSTGTFSKAMWNYTLVSGPSDDPGANVIHNPSFVFDVLANTNQALAGAPVDTL
jgi:hypothetical protein